SQGGSFSFSCQLPAISGQLAAVSFRVPALRPIVLDVTYCGSPISANAMGGLRCLLIIGANGTPERT
ncbi:MAG: hypothetical protein QGG71_27600, partial [Pirellulaceae bacterium]|nr:hypothetical protein [Pirellulaceae bacterium]